MIKFIILIKCNAQNVALTQSFLKRETKCAEFLNVTMKISILFPSRTTSDIIKDKKMERTDLVTCTTPLLTMGGLEWTNKRTMISNTKKD
jgi:hypothetical protein